jgi:hypothetical protein
MRTVLPSRRSIDEIEIPCNLRNQGLVTMAMEHVTTGSYPQLSAPDLAKMGETQIQNFITVQRELWSLMEQARQGWLGLAEAEGKLASELATDLSSCKTVPEIMKIYQDWMTKQGELIAQDSQRLLADGQKFMTSATTIIGDGVQRARG